MKKSIILFLAVLCGLSSAVAQDLIFKTDASQIEAKVTEITPAEVRYKRFSNPDGPTYVLPVKDIRYIQYPNGEKELFSMPETIPAVPLTPATPATIPATPLTPATQSPVAAGPQVEKTYEIGDFYNEDGLKGVVCQLTEDRKHGQIISMEEIYLPWSTFRKEDFRQTGVTDRQDGLENMKTIEKYIAGNNLSWADFPAFDWCRRQGEGWYLPAIDELLVIGHLYNGGTRMASDRRARNRFNDSLKENGGERMDRMVYYFSSTEMDEKNAFTSHMAIDPPYVVEIPKHNKFLVRAVHKF